MLSLSDGAWVCAFLDGNVVTLYVCMYICMYVCALSMRTANCAPDCRSIRTYIHQPYISIVPFFTYLHMYVCNTYVLTYILPFLPTFCYPASSDCSRSASKGQEVKRGEDQCAWPGGHRPGSCRDGGCAV